MTKRNQNRLFTALLVLVLLLVLIATSACGSDGDYKHQDENIAQIQRCINNGGHPITSSDQYGAIFYVACDTNGSVTP